ncbi:filamentous hemagglutinin N-terminal domain-containing protein [Microbulbifer sp. DLAB2-AF]|uniref:filamentous hemagglutinin N-terminal domain-containing protein n=1 Tax=Microbulbifer sp. DLAB2-AF TaxID=3243395 RepID=UPI00403A394F
MKAQKNTLELKKLTSAIKVSRLAYAGMFAGLLSPLAHAGPEGGVVTGGSGTIDVNGTTTTIDQNTDLLSIDWDSFNLSAEELVKFLQPNTSSIVLNRILDQSASTIHGAIEANGHVILVNPRGVLFTESATINVGAITASGLDMSPEDFMNGDFTFTGEDGSAGFVVNKGVINAASAVLVGKQVTNASSGLISAELVSLAAADEAILTFDADGMIGVQVTKEVMENDLGVDSAVLNEGNINGAQVLLEASVSGDLFTAAVNNEGTIKAQGIDTSGGKIRLFGSGSSVINSGELQAAGATGGQVVIEGDTAEHRGKIDVRGTAGRGGEVMVLGDEVLVSGIIDARGTADGGEVLIGGDYQGKNDQVRNAKKTKVTKDAHIDVSGMGQGDGGEVIVWADHTTEFAGTILAESGEQGGDGGFVETSGKVNLNLGEDSLFVSTLGSVDGKDGEWLLDPGWFYIAAEDDCSSNCMTTETLQGLLGNNHITIRVTADSASQQIDNNPSTDINTTGSDTDPYSEGIWIGDSIDWGSSSKKLTLISDNNIYIDEGVNLYSSEGVNDGKFFVEAGGDFINKGSIAMKRVGFDIDGSFQNFGSIEVNGQSTNVDLYLNVGLGGGGSDNRLGTITYTNADKNQNFVVTGGAGIDKFYFLDDGNDSITVTGNKAFTLSKYASDNSNFTFSDIDLIDTAGGEDTVTSTVNSAEWTLTSLDNQVNHSGIDFLNANAFKGGKATLNGDVDGDSNDSYTLASNGNVTVDDMTFVAMEKIVAAGGTDTVEASGVSGISLLGSQSFSAAVTNGTTSTIIVEGIEKVTDTGEITGTSGADSFAVVDLSGDIVVQSQNIDFYGVSKVDGGDNPTDNGDALTGLADTDFTLSDNSGGFSHSAIDFVNLENVTATGSSQLVGTAQQETYAVQDNGSITVNGVNFAALSGVSAHADGLTGLDDIVDATLYSAGLALTGNVKEVKLLTTPDTNFVFSGIGQAQTQILDVSASGDVAIVAGDNALDIASINFTSLEEVNGGGSNTLKVAADVSLNNSSTAGDFDSSKMLFSGFNKVNSDSAITLTGTDAADEFTVGSAANQVAVEGITFTNVDVVAADAATGDKGESDIVNATAIDVYLTGNDKELSTNGMLFKEIETGNVTDKRLFGSATKSDSITILAANEITANAMGFTGISELDLGAGGGSVTGVDGADWQLTATNKQVISSGITFSNADTLAAQNANLVGVAGRKEEFTLEDNSGIEVAVNEMTFTGIDRITDNGSDTDPADSLVSNLSSSDWSLTATDNQVTHSGITITGIESLSGGLATLNGDADSDSNDSYTLASNGDVTVDRMTFAAMEKIVAAGGSDTVEAGGVSGISLLGSQSFSAAVTNGTTSTIIVEGIEKVTDTGEITGTSGADSFAVVDLSGDIVVQSQNIDFYGVSKVDGGDNPTDNGDALTGLADTDFTLSDNSGGFSHSAIDFVNLENVTATGSSQLVGTAQQETYAVQDNGSITVNGVNFAALSGVSAHADGLTGLDDIVDATLYSAGLALTGNVKEVKLLTTPDTNFVFSGIGQAQTQILDVSASGDVAIVAGDNALDIASINFTSLEEVNGGGSNTLKVAADVSLNNSSTAGDFDSSKMLFSGFNKVNSDSAITLTGTDAADEFTVGSAANQVAVEGITFTNVDVVAADAATGDKGESDIVNATAIDVYLTGNDKELSTNGMLFKEIETGNVTDKRLFGSATKSDSITILAANEITANAMGFTGISELDLGAGGGSVTGVDGADWQLTATNKQVISSGITFSNADTLAAQNANLVGVAGRKEEFTLEDNSGIEVAVNEMTFTGIDRITDNGSDTDPADSLVSNLSSSDWSLTATDNQVTHSGITITGIESLSGGLATLNGDADSDSNDSYTLASNGDVTVDRMTFAAMEKIVAAGGSDTVEAGGVSGISLLGSQSFSAAVTNGTTSTIIVEGIEKVTDTGEITGTSGADSFAVVDLSGDIVVQSQNIDFYGVSKVDGGDNPTDNGDALTGLADTDFTLSDNSGGFSHSAIDFVNLENVTATGSSQLVGTAQQETYAVQDNGSITVNGVNFAALSGVSAHADGLTGLDDIVDATLYSAGLALTGNVKEVKLLTTPDTNFVFSGIGQAQTQILDVSASGDVAIVAGDNALDIASINFTSLEEVNGGGSNTLKVAADVSLNNSSTAGDFDSSKMLFSGFNKVNSDSAITLTGTDAADEFTVGSAANQVAVEGITFTNVDVVAADAATGDKGESDIVNATAIDVYLTGNDKELSTNGMLFKEIETGNVTDKRLFGSATKSDSITILAANEITANAMGFTGISELDLGAGGGSVTGVDGADWQLTATNKQVISSGITFSNADTLAAQNANLVGVAGRKEEFTLEDNSGIEVAVNEMTFTGIDRITDNGSDTDPADSLVSNLSSSDWSLTATDNQVTHSGITITGIESLSGGLATLNGDADSDSNDSYTLASNGDVTVDRMTFAAMEKIVAAGGSDTVEAGGVSGISLLGSQSFSAAVTNGTTSTIIVEGIEKVTDTGEITGTSGADSFAVVDLSGDIVVQSQNIDFYGVSKVDGGDNPTDNGDALTGLADTDFTLSDNSGGFSHSAIDFVNLENVTATGSSQLVGTAQQETYAVQDNGSITVNGVNFAALSGVSAHADGLTGLDDIVDATLYSAGLALTGNVKEVKLLTTPDTNFVFSGIGQAQTQILDVSASGDVAIVAGDNALDIASINFTSLEEVNGGGSNTLKVAADVSLNNSSTAGDFDSSKMLFSGFNKVNSDSAITLTGTDAADEFTVGSAANQVAVEGITFTNVDVVAADAATGDKGESDIVNATAIDVYLTGNDKELSTNGMLFKEIETGNVTDKRLFGSATKSDSITILAANEITANAMGFTGISELDLGAGGGSVTGVDGADWQLTATNKQVISSGITFSNADTLAAQNANLVGVTGRKEEFTLEDNSGIEVAVNEMTFTGIDRITDNGSDTDPADSLVSNLSSSDWSLTATDNQVTHSGITITGIESLSGGLATLNGDADSDSNDSYTLASNGDVTVDRMTFAAMEKIVAAGGSDTVEAGGVSGISLLGSQSFSAAVTNGTTSTIIVEGIEKVTDTGEITGTSGADSFAVVDLSGDIVVQSQNIDFYGVSKVDGGDNPTDNGDALTGLADTDFTLSDNSGGFSHSAIDFVNLENVTATGSSQLVGTAQQETYAVQDNGSITVNGVNFAALSGVSAHADGLTGLDDIVDATLYSAGLALTGNVKEVKLLTTPDTNFVFSGIGQAQTQILDVSASGDVAIVAGDNALDIASINFTSLEEVNGGGSNTLKVAADVSLNNSSTAGDFDSSKMLFSGFNKVNSDSAITLTGTDAADEFTVGSAANQVAVEGITFTNVDVVAADAATGDKGESDIVNATAIDVYLTGNDKELSTNGMLFKEIETGNVTDKRLFGSATKSDSITILAANEITANAMGFTGISELDLGAGGGSVTGVDGADWQLTATNKQVISSGITFSNADTLAAQNANLVGVAGRKEEFTLEDNSGIEVAVNEMTFTGIDRITDNGSDTDPADSLVSNLSSSDWSLTATDNQVTHSGITITGIESLSGGLATLNGDADSDSNDSYTLASNGDVTVDRMTFAAMEKIVAAGGSDTVEAGGVSGISLLGSQSFSAAVTNGTTSTIIVEGIEKVTDTGEITGTSGADSFAVVDLSGDIVVQSQNIDFYGVSKVDGGDNPTDNGDALTGLADTDFTLSDNSGGFSHSAIDFVNLENVTATGSSQLVGTAQQETYAVQDNGSITVNGVNFAALSGVSAHADGLTGLDDIVDATLYSAGLALTGNVKEVKLLTTPDTNFVFSGIGQAQTQILDVSASGDVAIVAGDNALDIASINFTSLEEVNGGGSNTLKVAADVSLNNSSTAGDFDSSKMLFSGFNKVNSDSAITLTGTDAADEFTVGSAANQVAVEGITFTNVDVVAADAATGDKGESDIVNATAIDVYLTGNDKELSTNGMLFKEIETGNVTDKRLFGSATKSDSITILAANEITANAMGFTGISELDLGAGGGSVTGVDGADWQLTATNKQVISSGITFSNADTLAAQNANLVGVAGRKEEFTLEDNSGIEVAVNEMTFTGIDRITDNGSDTDPADSLVSNLSSSDWSLTATDNQVTHSGITITGIESLSGGLATLNGDADSDSNDSYTLASNGDVTVDRMTFAAMEKIVAAGGSDTVEAGGVSGISLLGSQSFSAAVTNGTTSTIIVEGIEKVTDTGEITGTSGADSFAVVDLSGDIVVQSQNIDFYGVSKVDGGDNPTDNGDALTGLADTDFTLSDNSGGFSHSAIDFVNLENVTATGSSQLVGTAQQETYAVQDNGSITVNGVNFAALSGVSAHADGLTGLDDIVDATLYSAGLALTGNVKEVKLLTTPDTNFVFSGIGQAQTQILDVSASGDVAIVAGDNALDIASINFTSLEEVNGGGSNTLKVAADVSLNNSSTAGDFDSSKMLFSGFNKVNSDSAITLTGTDAADEFTVGSAANQVAVEGITFTNVDVVAADAATGDKGESDIVNATAIDVYLTGNDKELSTNGMLFKEIETGNVTDKRLFGSATKSDSITILAANEITANAMGFTGISELDLGAGGGSVTGVDGADWQLTATNKQVISSGITFSNADTLAAQNANLVGVAGRKEEFTLEDNSGIEVAVNEMTFTGIDRITDNGSDTDPADSLVSNLSSSDWSLTATDNQVTHSGITITGIESLSGGLATLNGDADSDSNDSYTLASNGDVTVDRMTFAAMEKIVAAGGSDTVEAGGVSGISLLGSQSFSAAVTNGTTSTIIVEGIEKVTDTGEITGTSGADSFAVVDLSGDIVVQSQNIDFYGVSKVDGGDNPTDNGDALTGLADTDFTLSDNSGGFSHSAIDFVNLENVTATGSSQLVGTAQQETYAVQDNGSITVNGVNFAALSGVSAHADGLTGLDDIVDATLYSAGLALTGNVKEVKLLTTPDTNFVFSGIGQAQTQILDVSASGDVAIVAGDNALDIASINFTSLEEVNGGGSNTLKVAADVSLNNSSTAGDFDSSKMLFSGFNKVNSDSAITLTGTDAADEFTVGSAANQVAVEGITFTNVDVVAADAATGDKGESDKAIALGVDVNLSGNAQKFASSAIDFSGFELVETESLFGTNLVDVFTMVDSGTVSIYGMTISELKTLDAGGSVDSVVSRNGIGYEINSGAVSHDGIQFTSVEQFSGSNAELLSVGSNNDDFTVDIDGHITISGLEFRDLSSVDAGSGDNTINAIAYGAGLQLTGESGEVKLFNSVDPLVFKQIKQVTVGKLYGTDNIDQFSLNDDSSNPILTASGMTFSELDSVDGLAGEDTLSVEDAILDGNKINGITFLNLGDIASSTVTISENQKGDFYIYDTYVISYTDINNNSANEFKFTGVKNVYTQGFADSVTGYSGANWIVLGENSAKNHGVSFHGVNNLIANNGGLIGKSEGSDYLFSTINEKTVVSVEGMEFHDLAHLKGSETAGNDSIISSVFDSWQLTGGDWEVQHGGITISNVDKLKGGSGILVGSATGTEYTMATDNELEVYVGAAGMAFYDLSALKGGTGADSLESNLAADWLLTDNTSAVVTHNGLTISNVDKLKGGSGILVGSATGTEYTMATDNELEVYVGAAGMAFYDLSALKGGTGADSLESNLAADWLLTDNTSAVVTHNGLTISNVDKLKGGSGILVGSATGTEYTMATDNELEVYVGAAGMAFYDLSALKGGTGADSLESNLAADWLLTDNTSAVVTHNGLSISNVDKLKGGSGILVGSATGTEYTMATDNELEVYVGAAGMAFYDLSALKGGTGADSLESNLAADWLLTDNTSAVVTHNGLSISNVDKLKGGSGILVGSATGTEYTMATDNELEVYVGAAGMAFYDLSALKGGTGADSLESNLAADWLLTDNTSAVVTHNGLSISNVDKLKGGSGILVGSATGTEYTMATDNELEVYVGAAGMAFYDLSALKGGTGADSLESNLAADWLLTDNTSAVVTHNGLSISNVDKLKGGSGILVGSATGTEYTMATDNELEVYVGAAGMAFYDLSALKGGTGADSLESNLAADWLLTDNTSAVVTHNGLSISNVDKLKGGSGILVGSATGTEYTMATDNELEVYVGAAGMAFYDLSALKGGTGADSLESNLAADWLLTDNTSAVVTHNGLSISNVDKLKGGSGILVGSATGTEYTMATDNELEVYVGAAGMAFYDLSALKGGTGADSLESNLAADWLLTDNTSAVVTHNGLSISNVDKLKGGSGILVGSATGTEYTMATDNELEVYVGAAGMAFYDLSALKGGTGADSLESNLAADWLLTDNTSAVVTHNGLTISNVDKLKGGSGILVGSATGTEYTMATDNELEVYVGAAGMAFYDLSALKGGTGADSLESNLAADWLLTDNTSAVVTHNGLSISNVDKLKGGSGILVGSATGTEYTMATDNELEVYVGAAGMAFYDLSALKGGTGADSLESNLAADWLLTDNTSAVVTHNDLSISNVDKLKGGSGILVGSATGTEYTMATDNELEVYVGAAGMAFYDLSALKGGTGADSLESNLAADWLLTDNTSAVVTHNGLTISNVDKLKGGSGILVGSATGTEYTMATDNELEVYVGAAGMAFYDLSALKGGTGADSLESNLAADWLLTDNTSAVVTHNGLSISNVDKLKGGSGILVGSATGTEYTMATDNELEVYVGAAGMAFYDLSALKGGTGADSLESNLAADWLLTDNTSAVVTHNGLTISNVDKLKGGSGILVGSATGTEYTMATDNELEVYVGAAGMAFYDLSALKGGTGADSLESNLAADWLLTDNTSAVVTHNGLSISNVDKLKGGSGILVGSATGTEYTMATDNELEVYVGAAGMAFYDLSALKGGTGADSLESNLAADWLLTDNTSAVVTHNGLSISNVDKLKGGSGILVGSATGTEYTMATDNELEVYVGAAGMAFYDLSALKGGTGADSLESNLAADWLLTDNTSAVVTHNGLSISNVDKLKGGSGILVGSATGTEYTMATDNELEVYVGAAGMAFYDLSALKGGTGADSLESNLAADWLLTDNTSAVVTHNGLSISNVDKLKGGSGILVGSATGTEYTMATDNELEVYVGAAGMAFYDLSALKGGTGADSLESNLAADWLLTDNTSAVVTHNGLSISNVDKLKGGSGILVGSATGTEYTMATDNELEVYVGAAGMAFYDLSALKGGTGADSLESNLAADWLLTDNTSAVVTHNGLSISNVDKLKGGSGILVGSATGTEYTMATDNELEVYVGAAGMAFYDLSALKGGTGADSLESNLAADWLLTDNTSAVVTHNGLSISNVDKLKGGSGILVGSATGTEYTMATDNELEVYVGAAGMAFYDLSALKGGTGADSLQSDAGTWQLTGTANALEVNGVQFSGIDSVEANNAQLNGTDADDVLTLAGSGISTAGIAFTGITKVSSGGGTDQLIGTSGNDTFALDSNGDITAAGILFTGLESVDTGEGEDTVNAAGSGASWTSSSNGSSLENGAAQARVNGLTVLFDNLEMVQGVGTYIGQDIGSNYVFDSLNSMEVAGVTFADLESLSAGSGNDTIQGANIDAVWDINDAQSTVSGNNKKLVFSGIEAINAGSGQDTFNLNGGELASIDTGAGNDTVILSATTIDSISLGEGDDYVEVNENSSDTVALSGGSGSDSFQYNLAGDTWQVKSSGNKVGNFSFSDFEFLDNTSSNLTLETDFAFDFENGGVNSGSFNKSGVGLRFAGSGMRLGYDGSGDINVLSSATGTIGGSLKAKRADLVVSGDVNIESDVDVLAISTSGPDVDITVLAKDNLLIDEINAGRGNVQLASEGFGMLTAETYGDTHITAGNITLGTDTQLWSIIGSELVPLRMDALTNVAIVSVSYYEPEFIGQVPNFTSKGDELQSIAGAQASQGLRSAIQNGVEDFTQVDPAIFSAVKPYSSGVDAVNSPEMRLRSGELLPAAGLSGTDEEDPEFDARLEESQDVTVDYREQETLASINSGG